MKIALPSFSPPLLLRGPTLQTLASGLLPVSTDSALPAADRLLLEMEPGEKILLLRTPTAGPPRGRLLLLHGLGGCADSRCLRRILSLAHEDGWEVIRMNARGAGEGIAHSRHLPHAGRSQDLARVLKESPWTTAASSTPLIAAGVSLGGAVLLRYLGETGAAAGLDGAVAVNPPTDLALSLQQLERPSNRAYQLYFVTALRRDQRMRSRLYPDSHAPPAFWGHRSVRSLDETFVAPDAGYSSAEAYYAGCSAAGVLSHIRTPTLIFSSQDDPFVPAAMLLRDVPRTGSLELVLVRRGGHLGYLQRQEGRWSFWAGRAVLQAARQMAGRARRIAGDLVPSNASLEKGAR